MTNFIPIFPLSIVVFPGEKLHLHIFEPRYKQLISESFQANRPFGIPSIINNRLNEFGTLVDVMELNKMYTNGEMDITARGIKIFRILEEIKEVPQKLYGGAIVNYPPNKERGSHTLMKKVIGGVRELHRLLKVQDPFKKPENELWSYDIAHQAGLSLQEEYELLSLFTELQRQEYLKRHLAKVLPVVAEMEHLKERIRLNGHFKNVGDPNA